VTRKSKPKSVKITYFDLAGAAEKLRLCCAYYGFPFEDDRLNRADWPEMKKTMKFGQVPMLTVDGVELFQSGAMLRYLGRELGDGSLYPSEAWAQFKVEEMLGLSDDIARAFMPALYVGMRPEALGHVDLDPDAKAAKVKAMRETFLNDQLPGFMKSLSAELKKTGAFVCGPSPTIADMVLWPQTKAFIGGFVDHLPTTCLEPYPEVLAWMGRMAAIPTIKSYYDSKKK